MSSCVALTASLVLLNLAACSEPGEAPQSPATGVPGSAAADPGHTGSEFPSEIREFENWTAICDNGNDCWAYSGPELGGDDWIMLYLAAGPDAQPTMAISLAPEAPGQAYLSVDGKPISALASVVEDDRYGLLVDQYTDLRGLLRTMAFGQALHVTNHDLEEAPWFPLKSLAAALRWIDQRQGRSNTTTALINIGDLPASTVPPAPPLPIVRTAPAISQEGLPKDPVLPATLEALADVKQCRADMARTDEGHHRNRDDVGRLAENTLLWSVQCWQAAYNQGHRFYLTDNQGRNPRALRLQTTEQMANDTLLDQGDILINAHFDLTRRTMSSFIKTSGPGDCGVAAVWTWTGTDFVLTDERWMSECIGIWADKWPTTWRSQ